MKNIPYILLIIAIGAIAYLLFFRPVPEPKIVVKTEIQKRIDTLRIKEKVYFTKYVTFRDTLVRKYTEHDTTVLTFVEYADTLMYLKDEQIVKLDSIARAQLDELCQYADTAQLFREEKPKKYHWFGYGAATGIIITLILL